MIVKALHFIWHRYKLAVFQPQDGSHSLKGQFSSNEYINILSLSDLEPWDFNQ